MQFIINQTDPSQQFPVLLDLARDNAKRMNSLTVQYLEEALYDLPSDDPLVPAATSFLIGEFLNVNLQKFELALAHYRKARRQLPAPAEPLRLRILERIAALSLFLQDLESAIPATDSCILLARKLEAWFPLAHCLNCKGNIRRDYYLEPPHRISYYRDALEYHKYSFRENANRKDTNATLLNLYFITSINLAIDTFFPKEAAYLDTASMYITPDSIYDDFRAQNWYLRGQLLAKRGDYAAALDTFRMALDQFTRNTDTTRMMQTHYLLGEVLHRQKQFVPALSELMSALDLAPIVGSVMDLKNIYALLHVIQKELDNPAEALAAHETLFELEKQGGIDDRNRLLMGMEAQYGLKEKQQEILEKQQELIKQNDYNRQLLAGTLILIVLLGLLLFSFLKARKNRNVLRTRNAIIIQQKQQLEELDNMKSQFFTNISHELKTPLALIKAPLEYLQKQFRISQGGDFFLNTALSNTSRLEQLVNELLDFSKIESGKSRLNLRPYDLEVLVLQLIESFRPLAQLNDIELIWQGPDGPDVTAWADQGAFQKILSNLLSNAIKFSNAGSQITIALQTKNDIAILSVQDQGPGIYPDDLPNVFNRFHQSSHKDVHRNNSTGIGLSLSWELANLMDGKLTVESKRGSGSTFCLTLPLAETADLALSGNSKDETGKNKVLTQDIFSEMETLDKNSHHILIVEDHKELRTYLAKLLGRYFQVHTASNGQEAIDLISAIDSPLLIPGHALIISDLMMPVMDGFELLRVLKGNEQYHSIPVIMLTAHRERSERLKALAVGVDDYLVKPFDNQELLIRIKNLITRNREKSLQYPPVGDARHDNPSPKEIGQNRTTLDGEQLKWLKDLEEYAIKHIADSQFSVSFLSNYANMSERNFQRHIKKTTGLTPSEYIKEIRLHHARQLLESGQVKSVKAVSRAVGFSSQEYFSDLFHHRFGRRPSTYLA